MNEFTSFVVFLLGGQRYALPLGVVERIVRAVEVTALPNAPTIVLGVIDLAGRILPVFNLRRRFRLPEQAITPDDHFIVAHTTLRTVALAVDAMHEVIEHPPANVIEGERLVAGLSHIQGVIKLSDGLVLIHDLEKFLSLDEARTLDEAMDGKERHAR